MNSSGGHYLNMGAVLSPIGAARLSQLTLGCSVISLVIHSAGYSATYGAFCMTVWTSCFAVTAAIFVLDATRLHTCLPVSWENLTVTFAALAALLTLTASVVYPVYFVRPECPYNNCEQRNFRIAVTVCSWAACVAYGVEVFLSRAKPGRVVGYMATPSGILKVVQSFAGCVIFGMLANGSGFSSHVATIYCVVVFAVCFAITVLMVALTVSGRTAVLRLPFDRFVVVYTFAAVLLYLSAAVVWPVFCFDKKYGTPFRPQGCPRGQCSWDVKLAVTVLCYVNLVLYITDLVYSQRARSVSQCPRV
ncbi:myeloid-associated differentiation marker-like protein 2 [Xyrauchen texanus]|uniref:myeloid-associated differentiation marker-like protein 2 n=1 Tax=Xyrauchen texanus TaxID=154827 RepID=UPI0022426D6B|nr:myeloid-associated differentiation marker-like protein 2 [Xyrauchen texanus]